MIEERSMWFAVAGSIAVAITAGILMRGRGKGTAKTRSFPFPSPAPAAPRGRRADAVSAVSPIVASQLPQGGAMGLGLTRMYTPTLWLSALAPYAATHGVPLEFVLAALVEESNGNPCAIGNPEQYGPDGNPRELGIYQFYNPDDLKILKLTGSQLRAYCSPVKVPYRMKDGRTIMGPSQEVTRVLTAAEMGDQAKGTIDKIVESRDSVGHLAMLSGLRWPTDGVDFWRLVKLWHGLPGLIKTGLHNVTAHLGHAPTSWAEYRHAIESGAVKCDAITEAYRGEDNFGHLFKNAETATATMKGKAIA